MNARDFAYLASLSRGTSGLHLDPDQIYILESRLQPLLRDLSLPSVSDLVDRLRSRPAGDLHQAVVESLANHETLFFRDVAPFEVLASRVIPEILARTPRPTLWSAACSTGQEPYSLAMLLEERFPGQPAWILASDFSRPTLSRARTGRYTQLEVSRGLPTPLLLKYFDRRELVWDLQPRIRQRVEFREINLLHEPANLPRFDVILLRNMLIYVELETRRSILARIRRFLKPDGYLFLGVSESTFMIDDAFHSVPSNGSCYYRLERAAS